jgi:hypothetical protein
MLGVIVRRIGMALLLITICVFTLVTAFASAGFAFNMVDGFGVGFLFALMALCIEALKAWLPVVIYNQRLDAPRMAEWVFGAFLVCAVASFIASVGWAMSGDPSKPMAVVLVFAQLITAGGPLVFLSCCKWSTEQPLDGVVPVYQPAPPQIPQQPPLQALPSPQHDEQTIRTTFGDWIKQRFIPGGQVSINDAFMNYQGWAAANNRMQIHPQDFEMLMNEAATEAQASVFEGTYTGMSFSTQDQTALQPA